jgi:hypothetical protein
MSFPFGKIDKPGVYRIPIEVYHGQPCVDYSVSSTQLRTLFADSPAHAFATWSGNPNRETPKETEAFKLGRAAHHLLLGEDDYNTHYIVRPDTLLGEPWQGNRTACKKWIADQENAGRTVLLKSDVEAVRGMARTLSKFPLVEAGILNGSIEQSLIWQDKKTGLWLKVRPDSIPNDSGDFADLKTSVDYGENLDRAIFKEYRYDMQAAMVKWGCAEVLKREMASFTFVFVEKKRPWCVDALALQPSDLEEAEKDLRMALDTFAMCLKTGNWFGPAGTQGDARWAVKPEWARTNADYRRHLLERELRAMQPQIEHARFTEPV